ncbi:hypothetical protein G3N58_21150 [Paraburkholderia sp. Ac-20342]|uniref:hypothetical protein n=1 Tax=Paraburkholderia sp. Ac-20342 TaxID=2703889 RepID=UPI00197FDC73|nr:hypothetical protein [Paraburkholderia sp. Ac-20342]MBN3849312.1 hypothetical protein [Paraburkholderia sp. Ac-20342]
MKIVIVHHHVLPGLHEAARARIGEVTRRMSSQQGLMFRHVGMRDGMPDCLSSVTGWRSEQDCATWEAYRDTLPPIDGEAPYAKVEELAVLVTSPDSRERGPTDGE